MDSVLVLIFDALKYCLSNNLVDSSDLAIRNIAYSMIQQVAVWEEQQTNVR